LNKNDGSGTFQAAQNFAVGSTPISVTSADFNGDEKVDLAVANQGSSGSGEGVSVLLNNGDGSGTFQAAQNFAAGSAPQSPSSADFNSDGKADLAVANFSSSEVSVLLNTTSSSTQEPGPTCAFGEILQPVNDVSNATDQGMSAYKSGSRGVVPAKFNVSCDGNPIDTQAKADAHPMILTLSKVDSQLGPQPVTESTVTGSANTGQYFRFSGAPDNFYIYNTAVKNLSPGTYQITISEA
jgi:FG-GAP-like repeat